MVNLKFVTSESQTFESVEEMFNEVKYFKGCIPTAAVKIDDGEYSPHYNAFDAIRTAEYLKNYGNHRITLAIYTPEITESGNICITTTVYE